MILWVHSVTLSSVGLIVHINTYAVQQVRVALRQKHRHNRPVRVWAANRKTKTQTDRPVCFQKTFETKPHWITHYNFFFPASNIPIFVGLHTEILNKVCIIRPIVLESFYIEKISFWRRYYMRIIEWWYKRNLNADFVIWYRVYMSGKNVDG